LNSKERTEFVEAGHYYSAIPSLDDKERAINWSNATTYELPGINLKWEQQWALLEKLKNYISSDGIPLKKDENRRYGFNNPSFGHGDALFLKAMMLHFRPKKIIQVGSGYSSAMMLDVNEHHMNSSVSFEFIEPYPDLLISLMKSDDKRWPIHKSILQDINIDIFKSLQSNDILFIDSSHVLKAGSDVFYLFFQILPTIKLGVIIHIHDILYPFEYPASWHNEGRNWNEAYILRSFLQYNNNFSILLFPNALSMQNKLWFEQNSPDFLLNSGGSIWLTRNY
jgi:hypothetical protein